MAHRGYGGRSRGWHRQPDTRPSKLLQGLSHRELCSISIPTVSSDSLINNEVEITGVVVLGSYNWVNHPVATIIAPGSPLRWKEPELSLQLTPDSGTTFIDQNSARSPKSPLEPAIRAIAAARGDANQDVDLSDERFDIVTDRNSLRKLMRFICANGPNHDPRGRRREFRIDAQLASNGKTLVLSRYEESNVDDSIGFKGYGHSFEKAATIPDPPLVATNQSSTTLSRLATSGYHRIIRYDLLGLRFMVRFEVDAMDTQPSCVEPDEAQDSIEALANLFADASISKDHSRASQPESPKAKKPLQFANAAGSELRYVIHGSLVPQSSLVELTTLSSKYEVIWSDVYPQLFLSQTSVLKVAKHVNGKVDHIQTYTKDSEALQKAHADLSPDIRTLVALLTELRVIAVKYKSLNKPLSFRWDGSGELKAHTVERRDNLLSARDLAIF